MNNTSTSQLIIPFLWFPEGAEEAIRFYTSLIPESGIFHLLPWQESTQRKGLHIGDFHLAGTRMHAFDAGPHDAFNPSITLFVELDSKAKVKKVWEALLEDGKELMPLDKYDWSPLFGWLQDKYGVSWSIMLTNAGKVKAKVTPLLFFSGNNIGRAKEAISYFGEVFKEFEEIDTAYGEIYPKTGQPLVMHSSLKVHSHDLMVMDDASFGNSPFNDAVSLMIRCKDQEELDYYYDTFVKDGEEVQCGWVKDKFGISWQIVPEYLMHKCLNGNPKGIAQMMDAMMKMKKLDLDALKTAYGK